MKKIMFIGGLILMLGFLGSSLVAGNTSTSPVVIPTEAEESNSNQPESTPEPSPSSSPLPSPTPVATPTPTPKPTPVPTVAPTPQPTSNPEPEYSCNCGKTCTQISSCAEAQYLLNVCGCSRRDADKDGIACDSAPLNCQN